MDEVGLTVSFEGKRSGRCKIIIELTSERKITNPLSRIVMSVMI